MSDIMTWFHREKCRKHASNAVEIELLKDNQTKCKGVPGMGLCYGCKYRAIECIDCKGWSECTKRGHVCNRRNQYEH